MSLKKIIIAGEGGQGIQSLAHIFTQAASEEGKIATYLPNFGVEQRGGASLAFIQLSEGVISFPKFPKADILILFAPRAIKRIETYIKKDTLLIFDNSLISEKSVEHLKVEKVAIPASKYAKDHLIPRVFNIIMLGTLAGEVGLKLNKLQKEVIKFFAEKIEKEPQLKHFNLKALTYGYEIIKDLKKEQTWRKKILKK